MTSLGVRFFVGRSMAALSFVLMGLGVIWIKPILTSFKNEVGVLIWISGFRLLPGSIVSLIIFLIVNSKRDLVTPFRNSKIWSPLLKGSIIGSFVAVAFWMIGMAHAKVSIASILNQTAAIFLFIFSRVILKDPITKRRVVSLIGALIGVYIVLIG